MESDDIYVFFKKVVILGPEGSGKTSLTSMFETKSFKEESPSEFCNLIYLIFLKKFSNN